VLNHGDLNRPASLRREPEKVYQFNREAEKEDIANEGIRGESRLEAPPEENEA
jgi:hypothetical protein